jgi:hypothetical protein
MARKSLSSVSSMDDDWRTESDLRTLIEAEAVEKDPKRLAKAQALAKKNMLKMAAVASESKD